MQMYLFTKLLHVAPFRHGLLSHSLMSEIYSEIKKYLNLSQYAVIKGWKSNNSGMAYMVQTSRA